MAAFPDVQEAILRERVKKRGAKADKSLEKTWTRLT
jgi:hypothetical protein